MIPLKTFKEGMMMRLLPRVISQADKRGQIEAAISGFQDRIEQLRALVDGYQSLIDPTIDQGRTPNAIIVTFTSSFGKTVRRSLWLTPYLDTVATLLGYQNVDKAPLLAWAESLLGLNTGQVTDVALGHDQAMAPLQSTARLLAKTLGVMELPDSTPDSTVRLLARDQLQYAQAKGTPRALSQRLFALGFQDAILSPLWCRLAVRGDNSLLPREAVVAGAELDRRPTADQVPEDATYDITALRDGVFSLWSQTCSLQDSTQAYTSVNGDSPFVQVALLGNSNPNYRGEFSTREQYGLGDVATLSGSTYLATAYPPGTPGADNSGWTRIKQPAAEAVPEDQPVEYTLAGGTPSEEATAELLDEDGNATGITLSAIAPGTAFNGLRVKLSAWSLNNLSTLPSVTSAQRVSMGSYGPGTFRLSYVGGAWQYYPNRWVVTKQPTGSPGWFITFYAGSVANAVNLPEPDTTSGYSSLADAKAHVRDASVTFDHPGGEIWFEFTDVVDGYANNAVGMPMPTFKLEDFSPERRSLTVFDRLSKVKFRSSNFDALAAPAAIPVEPIQPNELLRDNPTLIPGYTAVAPYRPFGGASFTQVDATAVQLADDKLSDEDALVNSVIEDWRPATRTPRRSGIAIPIVDEERIAPYDMSEILFTTNGETEVFSGTSTDPLPPKFIDSLSGVSLDIVDLATEDLAIFITEDGKILITE